MQMQGAVEQSLRVWKALTLGTGLVAAATGALCIVITMTVAVFERTYEIGLLKAMGASNGQVMADFLREALLLALAGWMVGALAAHGLRLVLGRVVSAARACSSSPSRPG